MIQYLLLAIVFLLLNGAIIATTDNLPLDCVADADNLTLQAWQRAYPSFDIDTEQWQTLTRIEGNSVWVGYSDGGWNVPADVIGAWQIEGDIDNSPVSIWIWSSEQTGAYYIFPFADTSLFADSNGQHYGMHPCGGWRVDHSDFIIPVIEIINSSN